MSRLSAGRDRRALPVYAAGEMTPTRRVSGMHEQIADETLWDPHSHPTHELLWNERGMSMATVGERTWAISPHVGLWIPAGTLHTGHAPRGTWYRAVHFDAGAFESIAPEPVALEVTELVRLLVERLEAATLADDERARSEEVLRDVLAPAAQVLVVRRPTSALLGPIADALMADPGLQRTLAQWAASAGVSERTVARAFQNETGTGFSDWIAAVRAQRAMLLLAGGADLDDVAEVVGYASVSAFGSAFRRTTGLTPGRVRPPLGGSGAQTAV